MERHFQDLEVGEVHKTKHYTITKEEIVSFAKQFDPQPFHIDENAARDSMFGELVASGLHTLSLSTYLVVSEFLLGEESIASLGGLGMDELRWHEPVHPGDTLQVQIEIINKIASESNANRGYVDIRRVVFNGSGEKILSLIVHHVIKRKRSCE